MEDWYLTLEVAPGEGEDGGPALREHVTCDTLSESISAIARASAHYGAQGYGLRWSLCLHGERWSGKHAAPEAGRIPGPGAESRAGRIADGIHMGTGRLVAGAMLATNSDAGTVKIAAQLRAGGTTERWVRPERLRRGTSEF